MALRIEGYWPLYPTDGYVIQESANQIMTSLHGVKEIMDDVARRHQDVLTQTEGLLHEAAAPAMRPAGAAHNDLRAVAFVAFGSLTYFARAVDTFNNGVSRLNSTFASLAGEPADEDDVPILQPTSANGEQLRVHLVLGQRKYETLQRDLDRAAEQTAGMLERAREPETQAFLMGQACIPESSSIHWPGVKPCSVKDPSTGWQTVPMTVVAINRYLSPADQGVGVMTKEGAHHPSPWVARNARYWMDKRFMTDPATGNRVPTRLGTWTARWSKYGAPAVRTLGFVGTGWSAYSDYQKHRREGDGRFESGVKSGVETGSTASVGAGGAALGTLCGPAALVCVPVGAIGGGLTGDYLGEKLADWIDW